MVHSVKVRNKARELVEICDQSADTAKKKILHCAGNPEGRAFLPTWKSEEMQKEGATLPHVMMKGLCQKGRISEFSTVHAQTSHFLLC